MVGQLNRAELIGFIGQDPDIRHTNDGKAIVNLSIGTSENWTDKHSGERRSRTEWHRVVIFNKHAGEFVQKYLTKGGYVRIVGTIRTRKWQDQSGADRWSTEIVVEEYGGEVLALDRTRADAEAEGAAA